MRNSTFCCQSSATQNCLVYFKMEKDPRYFILNYSGIFELLNFLLQLNYSTEFSNHTQLKVWFIYNHFDLFCLVQKYQLDSLRTIWMNCKLELTSTLKPDELSRKRKRGWGKMAVCPNGQRLVMCNNKHLIQENYSCLEGGNWKMSTSIIWAEGSYSSYLCFRWLVFADIIKTSSSLSTSGRNHFWAWKKSIPVCFIQIMFSCILLTLLKLNIESR